MDYRLTDSRQLSLLLESFRKKHCLTQTEVGVRLGISQQSYARMVARPGSTSVDTLLKVLQVLSVDLLLQERSLQAEATAVSELGAVVTGSDGAPARKPAQKRAKQESKSTIQLKTVSAVVASPSGMPKKRGW